VDTAVPTCSHRDVLLVKIEHLTPEVFQNRNAVLLIAGYDGFGLNSKFHRCVESAAAAMSMSHTESLMSRRVDAQPKRGEFALQHRHMAPVAAGCVRRS
jgi:hypothetical protein